jgi:D-alanine-D-alanine ligase
LELARRGYQHVTVLDYADLLLQRGQQEATELGLPVEFCQGDARATSLPTASFDVILLMAQSFGYFVDATDDGRILQEVARLLTPGGRFLLDLVDREVALQQFRAESWHEANEDIVVCWKREWVQDMVHVREMVLSKRTGLLRDRTYAERLYSRDRIRTLLHEVGFEKIETPRDTLVYHPDGGTDYGLATNRMAVTARKRA